MKALIFDIKHYALHDGPGIRQTVFFKGCPLKCIWCHNPESRSFEKTEYVKKQHFDGTVITKKASCGYEIRAEELMENIRKDSVFFEESGGGVTFSGGEPLSQHVFLLKLLELCKKENIHTLVDTCGFASYEILKEIADQADMIFYDLKIMNEKVHKKYTGVSGKIIIDNLLKLDQVGFPVVLRYPLIPGITDTKSNIKDIRKLQEQLKNIHELHILPYHAMSAAKYERFGIENQMKDIALPSGRAEEVAGLLQNNQFKIKITK
mgnify:CR=1 FL=1